jgi:hypothetical protein
MLNTQSRLASLVIWLAIGFIVLQFAWTLFSWPPLHVVVRAALDSEMAAIIGRNQTLVGAVLGLGGLAIAHLLNGWRNRTEARHVIERREKRLAGVLAREAEDLATACEQAARQLAGRGSTGGHASARGVIAGSLSPSESMLLGGSIGDVAGLGAGAASAVRRIRGAAAKLATLAGPGQDDTSARTIAIAAMELASVAKEGARLLGAVAAKGPSAGERMRLPPPPALADIEEALWLGAEPTQSRLQSAA